MSKLIKAVFITNIPVPYREKIHEIVANHKDIDYSVLYCAKIEPNRKWKIHEGNYPKQFLEEKSLPFQGNRIYFSAHIVNKLRQLKPDIIILGGLSLSMLYAFLWAKLHRIQCIFFSDSHLAHEQNLTGTHRLLRHIFYSRTKVFIGPSKKTQKLFLHYSTDGIFFQSHLCANNNYYKSHIKKLEEREYDLIFSGQITDIKMPFFVVDIVAKMQQSKPIKILVIGDGPDRNTFIDALNKTGASVDYKGFVDQKLLPENYTNAKLLLFPSKGDAWGIVANEALASGTPVLTSHAAGVADELVISNLNGYVLSNEAHLWAKHALTLLHDVDLWNKMSKAAVESVKEYSYENAADGIAQAIIHANRA